MSPKPTNTRLNSENYSYHRSAIMNSCLCLLTSEGFLPRVFHVSHVTHTLTEPGVIAGPRRYVHRLTTTTPAIPELEQLGSINRFLPKMLRA